RGARHVDTESFGAGAGDVERGDHPPGPLDGAGELTDGGTACGNLEANGDGVRDTRCRCHASILPQSDKYRSFCATPEVPVTRPRAEKTPLGARREAARRAGSVLRGQAATA